MSRSASEHEQGAHATMTDTRIATVTAREILDSRGNPTVEADVSLACGAIGRGVAPSGASTGAREALELRDGDAARYLGKGVRQAVDNVRGAIRGALVGQDAADQSAIDRLMCELDGTEQEVSALGAEVLL